jgi:hypothetical protein
VWKRFLAIFDGDYYSIRANVRGDGYRFDAKVVSMKFFGDDRGYDAEDRAKVEALEVGESVPLDPSPVGYNQWVLRIRDADHEDVREDEW